MATLHSKQATPCDNFECGCARFNATIRIVWLFNRYYVYLDVIPSTNHFLQVNSALHRRFKH